MTTRTNLNRAARLILAADHHREHHHENGACDQPTGFLRHGSLRCPAQEMYAHAQEVTGSTKEFELARTLAWRVHLRTSAD